MVRSVNTDVEEKNCICYYFIVLSVLRFGVPEEHKEVAIMYSKLAYDEEAHDAAIREDSYEDGVAEGESIKVIKLVCSKLKKGYSHEKIAEELEEPVENVRSIAEAYRQCGSVCDPGRIYEAMHAEEKVV